jgi:hypothetical protein
MGDSKILLNNVPDFGDGFIPIYFILRQFRSPDGLGHDAVGDFVQMEKISVVFSKIPFTGIHFLDGIRGWLADLTRRASTAMPSLMVKPLDAN